MQTFNKSWSHQAVGRNANITALQDVVNAVLCQTLRDKDCYKSYNHPELVNTPTLSLI